MTHFLDGKSVLITGGTGSFGQAFARHVLESTNIGRLIIFSRDEWKQWQMKESSPTFQKHNIRFFLGDIRDESRLKIALKDVDYIVHAAALKQVPAAEYNPTEFINTNVFGAMNIVQAALSTGVSGMVALSSDKAVNPINLYGATKLCSDKLCVAANAYVGKKGAPRFSIVRYGNVLHSRGSILPFWESLVHRGEKSLPITDAQMTRFWISLDDAVQFVLMALKNQCGGEIFIPKIPSFNIVDLAKALYPNLSHKIIGTRPGEKLHELLISTDDARNTYDFSTHYRIIPAFEVHKKDPIKESVSHATPVDTDFYLSSNHNPLFVSSAKEICSLVK